MMSEEELNYFRKMMEEAIEEHLEIEVVEWALLAMKNNPSLSICDALEEGYDEWVK